MPAALEYERVQAAVQRLGVATVTIIGPADVKDGLRAEDVGQAEADALAERVDVLAVLIADPRP